MFDVRMNICVEIHMEDIVCNAKKRKLKQKTHLEFYVFCSEATNKMIYNLTIPICVLSPCIHSHHTFCHLFNQ